MGAVSNPMCVHTLYIAQQPHCTAVLHNRIAKPYCTALQEAMELVITLYNNRAAQSYCTTGGDGACYRHDGRAAEGLRGGQRAAPHRHGCVRLFQAGTVGEQPSVIAAFNRFYARLVH